MLRSAWLAALMAAVFATPAPALAQAAGGGKKELVAKVLQLQQPGIEVAARQLAEAPAMQLMQRAGQALQRLPAERREAVARDIEADLRKYAEEVAPIMRDGAKKAAPMTIGPLLEEKLTEDELRQVIAMLESPAVKKFQGLLPDMQRVLNEKLIVDTRLAIEPKLRALDQTVAKRLDMLPSPAAASAPKK